MNSIRALEIGNFEHPDEVHEFPKGRLEIVPGEIVWLRQRDA